MGRENAVECLVVDNLGRSGTERFRNTKNGGYGRKKSPGAGLGVFFHGFGLEINWGVILKRCLRRLGKGKVRKGIDWGSGEDDDQAQEKKAIRFGGKSWGKLGGTQTQNDRPTIESVTSISDRRTYYCGHRTCNPTANGWTVDRTGCLIKSQIK